MKHLTKLLATAGAATFASAGCNGGGGTTTSQSGGVKDATSFKAYVVSDTGGWDDKPFNKSTYEGLKASQMSPEIQISTAESNSDADSSPNVESMVSDGCNLIIGVGLNLKKAIHTSVDENKDVRYALIDLNFNDGNNNTVTLDNARPLLPNTAEVAYLVGYVATGMIKTGKVAILGGIQTPSATMFMDGFADGVVIYNRAKGTSMQLPGQDKATQNGFLTQSFDDQTSGKEQVQQFISQGANITMPVAGLTGLGAATAAKADGNTQIIGVGSDQYEANPDYSSIVLTLVMKEIGASIEQIIRDLVNSRFNLTPYVGTLVNGGVLIAPFHDFDDRVPTELKADLTKLADDVRSGKLVIESQNVPK